MQILPDDLLKDRYDVIGAGLGGMTAAGLLAKRGRSVLMIKLQNKPATVVIQEFLGSHG